MAVTAKLSKPAGRKLAKSGSNNKKIQFFQSYSYVNRKVWYHQIWIPNNLGFMVLILSRIFFEIFKFFQSYPFLLGLALFDTMASTKGIPAILLTYELMNNFHKNMSQIAPTYFEHFLFRKHLIWSFLVNWKIHDLRLLAFTTIFTYWNIILWIITVNNFSIIVNIPIFCIRLIG